MADNRKVFKKQIDALNYSQETGLETFVFSQEINFGGQRNFIVTTLEDFWSFYEKLPRKKYYEVIPLNKQSKLYLDIELQKHLNVEKDGYSMSETLIQCITSYLENRYEISTRKEDIIILDSSNSKKFSNHIIFKNISFSSNICCGEFLKEFYSNLSETEKKFFEVKNGANITSLVDFQVYTANRHLRIYLSEKLGKNTPFILSANSKYRRESKEIFMDSIVTNIPENAVIVPMVNSNDPGNSLSSLPPQSSFRSASEGCSPYSEIDTLINSIIKPGYVESWNYSKTLDSFIFFIRNYKYCDFISGEHSNNRPYFTFSIKYKSLHKRCFASVCSGKYKNVKIPDELLGWVMDEFDSNW